MPTQPHKTGNKSRHFKPGESAFRNCRHSAFALTSESADTDLNHNLTAKSENKFAESS
jgi:hypothetical protein